MRDRTRALLVLGVALFVLGLLTGAAIPLFANARMGLSAHMAGSLNGMVLVLFGLLWRRLELAPVWNAAAFWANVVGLYGIWLGMLVAAISGASRALPMAGAGFKAAAPVELLVTAIINLSALGCIVGAMLVLAGLWRAGDNAA